MVPFPLVSYFENRPVKKVHMRSWISQTKHTPKSSCIWINEAFPTPKAHICIFQSLFLLSNIINSSNLFNFINKIIPFTKRSIKRYKNGISLTLFVRFICVLIGKTCSFPLLYDISLCRYTPRSSVHPSIHAEVSCLFFDNFTQFYYDNLVHIFLWIYMCLFSKHNFSSRPTRLQYVYI